MTAPAARPVVLALAVVWLGVSRTSDGLLRVLDGYDRAANAAWRAATRFGRAVLRALGPLGRLLRRRATPLLRLLRRAWDLLGVRLLLRMFRPLGRWARACWAALRPPLERLQRLGLRLVQRLEPVLRALAGLTAAVEAAAASLGLRWHRLWAPAARAVAALRRPRRA